MTWLPPVPTLEVALDPANPGTFTDLSDRIIGTSPLVVRRGRDTPLDFFAPGELTVELDNTDRMLDPMNPAGLVYAEGGFGVPGCTVTLDLTFDGTTQRRFTGRLSGECWAGAGTVLYAGSARGQTVTLVAQDRLANSPDLPLDPWHLQLVAMFPDWWLPMDCGFPVLVDGSAVPNRADGGGSATLDILSGVDGAHVASDLNRHTPGLKLSPANRVVSAAADVMPDGDEADVTVAVVWKSTLNHSTGEQATILRMEEPGGPDPRWEIVVDEDGEAQVTTYDAGGTLIATDTIDRTGTPVARWDDGNSHLVIVRIDSGSLDVWFGGAGMTGGTLAAESLVYESDLIFGPSDVAGTFDEVTLWRRALSDMDIDSMVLAYGLIGGAWFGDNWLGDGSPARDSRLQHWFQAAGIEPNSDDTDGWRVPVNDSDGGFWSVSSVPANLVEALRGTVGPNGAVSVNADGFYVIRAPEALTDATYAAEYATISASFTDADTNLTAPDYRHAGVRFAGVDIEQVANRVEVVFQHLIDAGPPLNSFWAAIAPESTATVNGLTSKQTYGPRRILRSLEWYGWERAASLADALVDRYAFPLPQIDSLALDATGDTDLTDWLAFTCDLEKAVEVEWTDGGITRSVSGLNVQSERLELTSTTFTAELKLAQS